MRGAARAPWTSVRAYARSRSTGCCASTAPGPPAEPEPVPLPLPGTARFGDWEVRAGGEGEVHVAVDGH